MEVPIQYMLPVGEFLTEPIRLLWEMVGSMVCDIYIKKCISIDFYSVFYYFSLKLLGSNNLIVSQLFVFLYNIFFSFVSRVYNI